jgi:hypothetical protein
MRKKVLLTAVTVLAAAILLMFTLAATTPDATVQTKIYLDQGGDRQVVKSGGTILLVSGAALTCETGSVITLDNGVVTVDTLSLAQGSIIVGDGTAKGAALSAKTDGRILVGNGTTITSVAVSGDATLANTGALTIANGAVDPGMLATQALSPVAVPLSAFKKEDLLTALPNAGDSTNLGLVAGTHGTNMPTLQGADAGAATKTETVRILIPIPADYVAAGGFKVRCHAGMLTTVADDAATLDCEAFKSNGEGGAGADLCATAAQSINSLTLADKDFTVTGTTLAAGDILDVQLTTVVHDVGDAGVMKAIIGSVKLLYDRTP